MPLAAFLLIALPMAALAQPVFTGEVSSTGKHTTWPIAIPAFENKGGGQVSPQLHEAIMNDLVLSGLFNPPSNPEFVAQTDALDKAKGSVQSAEWRRIGVLYLLKGNYAIDGDRLTVEFMLYDTAAPQGYIFGRRYERKYSVSQARQQAHRIADEVVERITGEPGIASTQICYVRNNDAYGNSKQVMVMDSDGANAHPVIPGGSLVAAPCWGANATEIYYTTWRDFNPDLEGVILRSGARWWISRHVNLNISPDWCEKTGQIALTLSKDGNPEIYAMNRRGLDLRRLTNNRAIDSSPCWSPDGSQIAFTSDRSGSKQLYIMDASGGEARRLTYSGSDNDGASWAPGGSKKIAFHSMVNGSYQVCTINPDGSGLQVLTSGSRNEDPAWAPNGRVMVFTSNRDGASQLYSMYADGSNVHRLTSGAPSHSARWSPQQK